MNLKIRHIQSSPTNRCLAEIFRYKHLQRIYDEQKSIMRPNFDRCYSHHKECSLTKQFKRINLKRQSTCYSMNIKSKYLSAGL